MLTNLLTPSRVLALLVVVLLILSLLPARILHVLTGGPRHVVESVTTPLTHQLKRVSDTLRPVPPPVVDPVDLEELAILRAQNEALQQQLDELSQRLAQSEALGAFLTDDQLAGFKRTTAAVVRGTWRSDQAMLTLNRGDQEGLRIGQAVAVDGAQLVGRISDVGPVTATVATITQPRTVLEVTLRAAAPTDRATRLRTTLVRSTDGPFFEAIVMTGTPVQVGDLAQLADVEWPPEAMGFVVGRVVNIEDYAADPTLRKRIVVEPTRPLNRLRFVVVLVESALTEEP